MKQASGRHNFVILCYMSAGCNKHDLRLPLLIGIAVDEKQILIPGFCFFREQIMYKKTIQNFILSYNNVFENIRKKRLTSNFIYTYFKTLNLSDTRFYPKNNSLKRLGRVVLLAVSQELVIMATYM
jgi:hypothetical protein